MMAVTGDRGRQQWGTEDGLLAVSHRGQGRAGHGRGWPPRVAPMTTAARPWWTRTATTSVKGWLGDALPAGMENPCSTAPGGGLCGDGGGRVAVGAA